MATILVPAPSAAPTTTAAPAGRGRPVGLGRSAPTTAPTTAPPAVGAMALLRSTAVLVVAGAGLWWSMPRVTGVGWSDIGGLMTSLTPVTVLGLTMLWIAGLYLHSYVLTASLPGLSHRRAMTLNLTGSAVSNLLPGGGAAGVATNLMMMRRWSVSPASFAAFALVSNVWDVVAKLLLPGLTVLLALIAHRSPLPILVTLTAATLVGLGLAVVVGWGLHRRAARAPNAVDVRATRRAGTPPARPEAGVGGRVARVIAGALADVRAAWPLALRTARSRWPQLSVGMAAYVASQAALLWACLNTVGATVAVAVVMAAFTIERLATLIPITPSGVGLAEAGAVSVLVALGCDPVPAAAGVLLYRVFTVLLEIPVGAVWLAGWTHANLGTRRTA